MHSPHLVFDSFAAGHSFVENVHAKGSKPLYRYTSSAGSTTNSGQLEMTEPDQSPKKDIHARLEVIENDIDGIHHHLDAIDATLRRINRRMQLTPRYAVGTLLWLFAICLLNTSLFAAWWVWFWSDG